MTPLHPILHNFRLKLFSVAIATVIWFAIHYGIRNDLSISQLNINRINVPVTIIIPPGDPRQFKLNPPEVVVYAVGDLMALRRGVRVSVDLTAFHPPQSTAEDVHVEAPPEINVIDFNPKTVAVELSSK